MVRGSSRGKGFGSGFLIHAERAAVLVYLLDAGSPDLVEEYNSLKEEVRAFDPHLAEKDGVIALNKMDLMEGTTERAAVLRQLAETGMPVYTVSAAFTEGVSELILSVHKLVNEHKMGAFEDGGPEMVFRPKPEDERN
jgi:GTP-binding protein